jgi:hypothetical protein
VLNAALDMAELVEDVEMAKEIIGKYVQVSGLPSPEAAHRLEKCVARYSWATLRPGLLQLLDAAEPLALAGWAPLLAARGEEQLCASFLARLRHNPTLMASGYLANHQDKRQALLRAATDLCLSVPGSCPQLGLALAGHPCLLPVSPPAPYGGDPSWGGKDLLLGLLGHLAALQGRPGAAALAGCLVDTYLASVGKMVASNDFWRRRSGTAASEALVGLVKAVGAEGQEAVYRWVLQQPEPQPLARSIILPDGLRTGYFGLRIFRQNYPQFFLPPFGRLALVRVVQR